MKNCCKNCVYCRAIIKEDYAFYIRDMKSYFGEYYILIHILSFNSLTFARFKTRREAEHILATRYLYCIKGISSKVVHIDDKCNNFSYG